MAAPTGTTDPFATLADELGRLGRRLDDMGAEVLALRTHAGAAASAGEAAVAPGHAQVPPPAVWPGWVAGPQPGQWWPAPAPRSFPAPQSFPTLPPIAGPVPGYPAQLQPQLRPGPQPPAEPRASSALSSARLILWTGGAVTLIAVVLFMVVAGSRGWFSPPARIGAGAVLGVALVGIAMWLHRRETARTSALAVAATGFATLLLVIAATAEIYHFLDPVPALSLALVVGGAGIGIADRWRSELLAGGVTVGTMLLAPVLTGDWLLVALALALQLAALPIVLRRRWSVLMLLAAAGPVLYGSRLAMIDTIGGPGDTATTVALVLAVLAVASATVVPAVRRLPLTRVAVLAGSAPVPALVAAIELDGWGGAALAAVAGTAVGALAALPGVDRAIRLVAVTAAAVALFAATSIALDGSTYTIVMLGEAIVAAAFAARLRSTVATVIAMVFGASGVLLALAEDVPLPALVRLGPPFVGAAGVSTGALVSAVTVGALVLVLAVALLVAGSRVGWIEPNAHTARFWSVLGLIGLYGATGLVVALALLVAPDRTGFTVGHAIVTVSWTIAALVLLARGISRPALRIAGLVLVGAAVAKLILFDLTALDGLARVAAFLGAGLVLLAAGTRYARLVVRDR